MLCAIWYHLYILKTMKSNRGGVLLLVKLQALLKVKLLNGCFSRFLNCANGTKSRNTSHIECHKYRIPYSPAVQTFSMQSAYLIKNTQNINFTQDIVTNYVTVRDHIITYTAI